MKKGMRILVVDDELSVRSVLTEVLNDDGHEVTEAASGEEALEIFQKDPFPLVVTDIVMGGMSGLQLLQEIKQSNPDTQVVIITSNASLDSAIESLRSGAYDYLIKPFDEIDLISAVANRAIEKIRLIEENHDLIERLKELAIRDGLTGLYNHRHFHEVLAIELTRSSRHQRTFSLILLDVDFFKQYNDTHGHLEGDHLLSTLADLIRKNLRRSDIFARYGGEEFVVLLPETPNEDARTIAEEVRRRLENYPFKGGETQPLGKVTISMGVATFPDDGIDASNLIKHADKALYRAKDSGRNLVC